ncbi:hypothetical protein IQ268_09090 [Oculatella sp. LEGE 06141]|uniref:hypothetical protein n=1 Tax=Oculatella sp. LEGE 06141 TaxID=1828648 RepID=UPI00187EB2B9|nr:hypothetical protein [Oculatella sp. LEGE 06141]MBE9178714.1 hypothetical protein [Oculatella sp. LEGE 06141]
MERRHYVSLDSLLFLLAGTVIVTSFAPSAETVRQIRNVAIDGEVSGLSAEQRQNAAAIISTGTAMGMSDRDIQIALMAALQESSLKNLDHGDDWWFQKMGWGKSDSVGLFQQRDSWGSKECRMEPSCSSKLFFNALQQDGDRAAKSLGAAAQKVQNSAFPREYDKWEDDAAALLNAAR